MFEEVEQIKKTKTDPSQDWLHYQPLLLDPLFNPRSVALVGAKDDLGSVGRTIMTNLMQPHFKATIYPVNPKRKEVMGLTCYPSLSSLPQPVDLAVIVTPAKSVPSLIKECATLAIPCAIVISAGFKEMGHQGALLEQQLLEEAKKGGVRIIGPNCLGVMNPLKGLNATFAKGIALPGNIAFISQSGAMCTAVLDWSFKEKIGFSSFVSIGSMADIDWGDLISYLGAQHETRSILLYMETIGNPRSFLSAARQIALEKPIIVIKGGKSEAAASAAASHTGSLAGSDEVFNAAMERVGVLRVDTMAQLFSMASLLARQPLPKGPCLTIVTNAGGPAVLATDAASLNGAQLPKPTPKTIEKLNSFLPEAWSHSNPVDILGDALPQRFGATIDVLMQDQSSDGILVILSPQDVTDPVGTADCLRPWGAKVVDKPLLASWMGGSSVQKGIELLNQSAIPTFAYPDEAAWAFAKMWEYSRNLKSLYQVPALRDKLVTAEARQAAKAIIGKAALEGRVLLTEFESKEVLSLYGIPCVQTKVAHSVEEALHHAKSIGYPVVAKLYSSTITHKTDVGGVKLNLRSEQEVAAAYHSIEETVAQKAGKEHFEGVTIQRMVERHGYELILGCSCDPQFGPVLLFGTGGQLVEVFKDSALALPPLNAHLAHQLMAKTKIYEALKGVRGRASVDMHQLEMILVHFSQLIAENSMIKECDINPLLAGEQEIISLDARIVLYTTEEMAKKEAPDFAIRPYPIEYVAKEVLRDGTAVLIRPIRPEDTPDVKLFHQELSEDTVRNRYFAFLSLDERTAHERLVRICFNDYDREIALVAHIDRSLSDAKDSGHLSPILGIVRLCRGSKRQEAELKMVISDRWQHKGLGTLFMKKILGVAKQEGIAKVYAEVLEDNGGMIRLCEAFGLHETSSSALQIKCFVGHM